MSEFRLYVAQYSCSFAAHVCLEYVGADYEAIHLDFQNEAQRSSEYLQLNPKGRVPTLTCEQGSLTETPAILAYLAQHFPESRLAPIDDAWQFAQMQAFNSYLCATVHVAHAHRFRGYRWASEDRSFEDMRAKVPESMGACFALIEQEMLAGPWVLGENFSAADFYLATVSRWLESDGVDLSLLPKVIDHRTRVHEIPAVQRVIEAGG